jgi:hypothetical protein
MRWLPVVMVGCLLPLLFVPGTFHLLYGVDQADAARWRGMWRDEPIARVPRALEEDTNVRFLPAVAARALVNGVPVKQLRVESPETREGVGNFVFNGVDYHVTRSAGFLNARLDRGIRAADAMADLSRQLRARGIQLLIVPVPAKASIYPEMVDPAYDLAKGPNLNVDHGRWIQSLRDGGVNVLDLTDALWQLKATEPVYFAQETHWSQAAMRLAASRIASELQTADPNLPPADTFATRWVPHRRTGDLAHYVIDGDPAAGTVQERHLQLIDADAPLLPGNEAPVLVIGDSFAAQFVEEGASISQLIMNELGLKVESSAIYGGKAPNILRSLAGKGALDGKRAVVMVFTIRLLICCEWEPVQLP